MWHGGRRSGVVGRELTADDRRGEGAGDDGADDGAPGDGEGGALEEHGDAAIGAEWRGWGRRVGVLKLVVVVRECRMIPSR